MSAWAVLATWLVPAGVGLVQGYRLAHRDQGAVILYLRNHVAAVTAERDEGAGVPRLGPAGVVMRHGGVCFECPRCGHVDMAARHDFTPSDDATSTVLAYVTAHEIVEHADELLVAS